MLKGDAAGSAVAWDGEVSDSLWLWGWKLEKGLQGPLWPLPGQDKKGERASWLISWTL